MPMVDSLLQKSNNVNNSNKYYDYGSGNNFLLSPSSSNSILMNNGANSHSEEISTIFVVGFPENMQEREFQNMFMFSPGFEAAILKVSTNNSNIIDDDNRKQIIGFAKFRTRLEASDAKEILNGRKIDQEKGSVLKSEMAKKNLHTNKKEKTLYEAFYSVNEPAASTPNIIPTSTQSSSIFHHRSLSTSYNKSILDSSNSFFGIRGNKKAATVYPAPTLSSPFLLHQLQYNSNSKIPHNTLNNEDHLLSQLVVSSASTPILPMDNSVSTEFYAYSNKNMDQNPPCNTLYVGNLPLNTNEEELRVMFSKCLGYKRLSFRKSNNGPMCFVEFEDIPYATLALKELNGNLLSNSVKGGIRLSYSKNPLGVRQNIVTSIH